MAIRRIVNTLTQTVRTFLWDPAEEDYVETAIDSRGIIFLDTDHVSDIMSQQILNGVFVDDADPSGGLDILGYSYDSIHISPQGSDTSGDGSASNPYRTLAKVQEVKAHANDMEEWSIPLNIICEAGVYDDATPRLKQFRQVVRLLGPGATWRNEVVFDQNLDDVPDIIQQWEIDNTYPGGNWSVFLASSVEGLDLGAVSPSIYEDPSGEQWATWSKNDTGKTLYVHKPTINWQASTAYDVGDVISPGGNPSISSLPTTPREGNQNYYGCQYKCVTAGTSAGSSPSFFNEYTPGDTFTDGTVEWEVQIPTPDVSGAWTKITGEGPSSITPTGVEMCYKLPNNTNENNVRGGYRTVMGIVGRGTGGDTAHDGQSFVLKGGLRVAPNGTRGYQNTTRIFLTDVAIDGSGLYYQTENPGGPQITEARGGAEVWGVAQFLIVMNGGEVGGALGSYHEQELSGGSIGYLNRWCLGLLFDSVKIKAPILGQARIYALNNCRINTIDENTPVKSGGTTGEIDGYVGGSYPGIHDCCICGTTFNFHGTGSTRMMMDSCSASAILNHNPSLLPNILLLDNAGTVAYDNAASGLAATNVQTALDEIVAGANYYDEVFISPNGSDVDGNGSRANPYATVNHAVTSLDHGNDYERWSIPTNIVALPGDYYEASPRLRQVRQVLRLVAWGATFANEITLEHNMDYTPSALQAHYDEGEYDISYLWGSYSVFLDAAATTVDEGGPHQATPGTVYNDGTNDFRVWARNDDGTTLYVKRDAVTDSATANVRPVPGTWTKTSGSGPAAITVTAEENMSKLPNGALYPDNDSNALRMVFGLVGDISGAMNTGITAQPLTLLGGVRIAPNGTMTYQNTCFAFMENVAIAGSGLWMRTENGSGDDADLPEGTALRQYWPVDRFLVEACDTEIGGSAIGSYHHALPSGRHSGTNKFNFGFKARRCKIKAPILGQATIYEIEGSRLNEIDQSSPVSVGGATGEIHGTGSMGPDSAYQKYYTGIVNCGCYGNDWDFAALTADARFYAWVIGYNPAMASEIDVFPSLAFASQYEPGDSSDWADPDPENTGDALDRIAAAVAGLLATPIP